ncbi:DnaA regulatory inactivator Hda [Kangiella sediminilitoris]|uniref:DnaA regulatory inactivator Hda n=1 Tax=Kangiella sediminilitoris TaxID=1144748 RepID=A0A1B3BBF4_9GAMM|nr:DnaA regulatory inactivator Hda [Kangiella sediminilitoris]AOE50116.1 DnaA regulatory inactivator Hda [Kangiella sediminilitoris]
MQQLPLDIEIKADATFSNFIAGGEEANRQLVDLLKSVAAGNSEFIYLYGNAGTGRTHLLQGFIHQYSECFPQRLVAYLPLDNPQLVPAMVDGLLSFDAVCLDGLEHCLGNKEWETAFFNLYNHFKEQNKILIIAGDKAPQQLEVVLQDLKSRLSAMLIHAIQPLPDDAKRLLLQQKAEERGLELSEDVINYLFSRQQRDLPYLLGMLEKLDQASLQAQRRLTIPFVKQVLGL